MGGMSRRRRHQSEHRRLTVTRKPLRTRGQMTSRGGGQGTHLLDTRFGPRDPSSASYLSTFSPGRRQENNLPSPRGERGGHAPPGEGSLHQQVACLWAYLALVRGTTSGNDRWGTRVQGLSFGVRRLVAAFARRDSSRRSSAPVTSHRRQKAGASSRTPKTTPPVRAPAFDGHAKAAPYMRPDAEPRRRPRHAPP
jgi:hypothetical protein